MNVNDNGPTSGAGDYAIFLDTGVTYTSDCNTRVCVGDWLQFTFENCPTNNCPSNTGTVSTGVEMEEWKVNYVTVHGACQSGWLTVGVSCTKYVGGKSGSSLSAGSLQTAQLEGSISSTTITVTLTYPSGSTLSNSATNDLPALSGVWSIEDFNVYGYSNSGAAIFNPGVTITETVTQSGSATLTCQNNNFGGNPGEQNDLDSTSCSNGNPATLNTSSSPTFTQLNSVYLCNGTNNCSYCTSSTSCSTTVTIKAGDLIIVGAQGPTSIALSISDNASGGVDTSSFGSGWATRSDEVEPNYLIETAIFTGYNEFGCSSTTSCYPTFSDKITVTATSSGTIAIEVFEVPAGKAYTQFSGWGGYLDTFNGYNNCISASHTYICIGNPSSIGGTAHIEVASVAAQPGSSNSSPGSGYSMLFGTYNPLYTTEYSSTAGKTTQWPMTDAALSNYWAEAGLVAGSSSNGS